MDREALRMQALRDQVFLKGQIPWWIAAIGYTFFGIVAIVVIPFLYPPAKWCVSVPLTQGSFCVWHSARVLP